MTITDQRVIKEILNDPNRCSKTIDERIKCCQCHELTYYEQLNDHCQCVTCQAKEIMEPPTTEDVIRNAVYEAVQWAQDHIIDKFIADSGDVDLTDMPEEIEANLKHLWKRSDERRVGKECRSRW